MVIHISYDEKFLDDVIQTSREFNFHDIEFIILGNSTMPNHVKSDDVKWYKTYEEIVGIIESRNVECIFFHSFSEDFAKIIDLCKDRGNYRFTLLLYGVEVFDLNRYREEFFLSRTKLLLTSLNRLSIKDSPLGIIQGFKDKWKERAKKKKLDRIKINAFNSLNRVAHFNEGDIERYLRPLAPGIQWFEWSFFSHRSFKSNNDSKERSDIILVGNSASPYNNHIDGLQVLSEIKVSSKILVPLSYGGGKGYVNAVIKAGQTLFKDRFQPITEFLRPEDYYNIINRCRAAIFFNIRSQAAGNIFNLIYNGIPVFMLWDSTLYQYLRKNDVLVFSVEEDLYMVNNLDFIAKYKHALYQNTILIKELFGKENTFKRYKNLYKDS